MLESLPDHYQTQFADNWEHLLQQGDSRLEGKCRRATIAGKERQFSQLGKSKMRLITTRNGKTIASDTPMAKRWVRPQGYDEVTLIDEFDHIALGELPAPESEHVQSHAKAANRTKDEVIIAALEGTAYIGTTGTDAVELDAATQTVAVNYVKDGSTANSGLILDKLVRAKFILDANEVEEGDRYFLHTAKQLQNLLDDVIEVKSSDYANVKALNEGTVTRFMGFTFCMLELLTLVVATDVRTCIAYHKAGVLLGIGQEKKVQMDIRADLNHSIQIRTTLLLGATRMEEERVVLVYCDESPE
jgi:hypothetical protein